MLVKAKSKGFYKKLRRAGSMFKLTSRLSKGTKAQHDDDIAKQFSAAWMEAIQEVKVKRRSVTKRAGAK